MPLNLKQAMQAYFPPDILVQLKTVGEVAQEHGCELYLIGGSVRDMLLPGREFDWDIDLVSETDLMLEVAHDLHDRWGGSFQHFEQYGTAKLRLEKLELDFARARTEVYNAPGANPVVAFSSLEKDLIRRDFSINAMALAISPQRFGELIDPFGGLEAMQQQRLEALHDQKFIEDPVRSWRAARFSVGLDFQLTPQTRHWIQQAMASGHFDFFFSVRILRELRKILKKPNPLPYFQRLEELDVWRCLSDYPLWCESLVNFCHAVPRWTAFWSPECVPSVYLLGLLVHLPLKDAKTLVPQLELSKTEARAWEDWVSFVPEALEEADSPSEIYEVLESLSPLCQYLLAALYTGEPMEDRMLLYARHLQHTHLEISGKVLLQWVSPGPHIKDMLHQLLCEKLNGELPTQALETARAKQLAERFANAEY